MAPSYWNTNSVLLFACAFLLQSDQNLLAPHLTMVAREFGMDDAERDAKLGGELALGLFLLGAPAALALGAAADAYNRVRLVALILVVGGVASLGTASSQSYAALFWWRALTGVSLGASLPVTFSLLADLFPSSMRTSASGRVGIAMSAGVGAGQFVSGFLGAARGWRAPFVLVGLAFLALAAAVIALMVEPKRGAMDGRGSDEESDADAAPPPAGNRRRDLAQLARTPTVWLVFVQGIPGCIPWGVLIVFLNDYLHADCGLSVPAATSVLTAFTAGGFFGMAVGGELGQRLYTWRREAAATHAALAEIASIAPLVLILERGPTAPFHRLVAYATIAGFCATQTGPIVRACLQNVAAPRARATAFAVFAIFDDLGKGGGPYVLARLVAAHGRRRAFVGATVVGWGVGGLINWCVALTLARDERRLQHALTAEATSSPAAVEEGIEMLPPPPPPGDSPPGADATVSALHRRPGGTAVV